MDRREPINSSTSFAPDALGEEVARCWKLALGHWSSFVLLADPVASPEPEIARIHMGTRQISVNYDRLAERGVLNCLEAVFAHEVGHHVRYPGSLAVDARLRLMEKSLIPIEGYSLINLFTDLLINARLGSETGSGHNRTGGNGTDDNGSGDGLREQLSRVYRAFTLDAFSSEVKSGEVGRGEWSKTPAWKRDPAFVFYLAIYEELWQMEPGALVGPAGREFEKEYPAYRADAQLLVQNLFGLAPNLYTQFIYFLSVMCRYVKPLEGETPESADPCKCGQGDPSPEDWADALTPNAAEREATDRALREGWISKDQSEHSRDLGRRISGLPGAGTANAEKVPEIMAAYYRLQAERYLLRPPPQRTEGESIVPTTPQDWEPGDPVRDIDWVATLLERGEHVGGVAPLMRTKVAEFEGFDQPLWQARVEIYLDVSGSMPDPRFALNAMTLAAQVLVSGAIRGGGWVRVLLYSGGPVKYWEWCRSEVELSQFLMHYIGAGTEFPFDVLDESVEECGGRQPIRVIITDRDFDRNYASMKSNAGVFARAAARSPHLVLLQHVPDPACVGGYRAAGATVTGIERLDDFPKMAADLTFALFPDGGHHGVL
jgi:hypothetical protein